MMNILIFFDKFYYFLKTSNFIISFSDFIFFKIMSEEVKLSDAVEGGKKTVKKCGTTKPTVKKNEASLEGGKKKTTKKTTVKKAPAKKTPAKKTPAKKTPAKKTTTKKTPAKKSVKLIFSGN